MYLFIYLSFPEFFRFPQNLTSSIVIFHIFFHFFFFFWGGGTMHPYPPPPPPPPRHHLHLLSGPLPTSRLHFCLRPIALCPHPTSHPIFFSPISLLSFPGLICTPVIITLCHSQRNSSFPFSKHGKMMQHFFFLPARY